jgi:hypothetical protein
MVNYGYFQIFGVNGKSETGAFGVRPASIARTFGVSEGGKFKFGTNNNHPGIKPIRGAADILLAVTESIIETFEKQTN